MTELLMICQQFDKNKADNKPQPLSAFQIKKIEENNTNMKKTLANNIPKNNEPQQNPTDI